MNQGAQKLYLFHVEIPNKPGLAGARLKTVPSKVLSQVPDGSITGKFKSFGLANFTT